MTTKIHGFMNVYRSGYFHRSNKPHTCNRHAGDFYLSREAALADIDPPSHYIDTVPISWDDPEVLVCNPSDSKPIPLSQTRLRAVAQTTKE
jgi:hypothetical protein